MLVDKDQPSDLTQVNLAEESEVRWWCTKLGCTEAQLRAAVQKAGPTTVDLERELKKHGKEILKHTGED